jgi:hypothetical protein
MAGAGVTDVPGETATNGGPGADAVERVRTHWVGRGWL